MAASELPPEPPFGPSWPAEIDLTERETENEFLPWVSQGGHFIQVRPLCPCGYREQVDGGVGLCDRCAPPATVVELEAARVQREREIEARLRALGSPYCDHCHLPMRSIDRSQTSAGSVCKTCVRGTA